FIPLGLLLLWQHGKRWRGAIAGATVVTLPWLFWSLSAASSWKVDPVQGYYTDYLGWWASSGLTAVPEVARHNLLWIVTYLGSAAQTIRLFRLRHEQDSPTPELGGHCHSWHSTRRLLDWLTLNSDRRDIIAAGADPLVYLYTGRQAYYPIVCPPLPLFYGYDY